MSYCELMRLPCETAPPFKTTFKDCLLCNFTYLMKELERIKDEQKLMNTRLGEVPEGYAGWIEYGPEDFYPKIHEYNPSEPADQ